MSVLGFTGTRKGMSSAQKDQLVTVLDALSSDARPGTYVNNPFEFHFGGALGADREARRLALRFGFAIHWHPCPGVALSDLEQSDYDLAVGERWHEVFPPLVRNRYIVNCSAILIAAPETDKEVLRSGTWATIRYARVAEIPVIMLSRGKE